MPNQFVEYGLLAGKAKAHLPLAGGWALSLPPSQLKGLPAYDLDGVIAKEDDESLLRPFLDAFFFRRRIPKHLQTAYATVRHLSRKVMDEHIEDPANPFVIITGRPWQDAKVTIAWLKFIAGYDTDCLNIVFAERPMNGKGTGVYKAQTCQYLGLASYLESSYYQASYMREWQDKNVHAALDRTKVNHVKSDGGYYA